MVFHHKMSRETAYRGNKPKPIHSILSGRKGGQVSKNAYLEGVSNSYLLFINFKATPISNLAKN
jgi:hypothetical protein